jgi:hypothetical protein
METVIGDFRLSFCGPKTSRNATLKTIKDFERTAVLNHRLLRPTLFVPPAALQGLLLLAGPELIPSAFPHGSAVPADVFVYTQFDNAYPFYINLFVIAKTRGCQHRTGTAKGGHCLKNWIHYL